MGPYTGFGWQLIGGDLALDLVNTVAYRRDRGRTVDRLTDVRDLLDWLSVAAPRHGTAVDLAPDDLAGSDGRDLLHRVVNLREALGVVVGAQVDGVRIPPDALAAVRRSYETAMTRAPVVPRLPLRYEIEVGSGEDVVTLLGLAAGRLCGRDDLDRLRRCDDAHCGWYFLDTSRNRSRRWCDPGDCGNRARARTFAARRRD